MIVIFKYIVTECFDWREYRTQSTISSPSHSELPSFESQVEGGSDDDSLNTWYAHKNTSVTIY